MIKDGLSTTVLPKVDEDRLVEAVRRDPHAFVALYDRYLTPVYRYLAARVQNRQDAEDLTSQVFLTALERFSQFRTQDSSFAAWLFTIARNKSIDFFRKPSSKEELTPEYPFMAGDDDLLGQVARRDETQYLFAIIAAFPPDDREVLNLRFGAEMTYAEIGLLLQRSEGAVKKQVYRLLERIEKRLEVNHD